MVVDPLVFAVLKELFPTGISAADQSLADRVAQAVLKAKGAGMPPVVSPPDDNDDVVLRMLLEGTTIPDAAERSGTSRQNVHMRIKRMQARGFELEERETVPQGYVGRPARWYRLHLDANAKRRR